MGDNQRYLPDFVIHNVGIERSEDEGKLYDVYVEVKGEKLKEKDIKRFYAFSGVDSTSNEKICPNPLLVVNKIPEDFGEQNTYSYISNGYFLSMRFIFNKITILPTFAEEDIGWKETCETGIFMQKDGKLLIRDGSDTCWHEDISDEERDSITNAFKKARSARFEFGETPKMK